MGAWKIKDTKQKSTVAVKPRGKKSAKYDVYSDEEDSEDGAARNNSRMDYVENYEYDADKPISNDQDSEIDESDAFNTDDDMNFSEFFQSGKKMMKKSIKTANILDESAESGSGSDFYDDDGDALNQDMIDISDMLNAPSSAISQSTAPDLRRMSESDADSDDDESIPISHDSDSDQFEEGDDVHGDDLVDLITGLDTFSKPKLNKRKRKAQEINEAFEESEYNVNSRHESSTLNKKVNLSDLVSVIDDSTSFGGLKKHLQKLDTVFDRKSGLGATVPIPLHRRANEKLNREAAYEQAKKQVRKWTGIVQRNRQADTLAFPVPTVPSMTNGSLVNKFTATSSLETEVQQLLEQGGLSEKKQLELEELEMNKLSKEEVAVRRAELAKMRSLMFFAEQKKKKIAKIKSKTYRKLNKKGKPEEELDIETLKSLDPGAARERIEKMDRDRALERMTLKHKNSGKWAKKMMGQNVSDETRRALMEQLAQHDELKRKIQGFEDSSDEERAGGEDDDDGNTVARAIQDLESMQASVDETEIPKKGIFAMKFMKRNLQDQLDESSRAINRLRDDFEGDMDESSDRDDDIDRNGGRKTFEADKRDGTEDDGEAVELIEHEHTDIIRMSEPIIIESCKKSVTRKKESLAPIFQVESFTSKLIVGNVNKSSLESAFVDKKKVEIETPQLSTLKASVLSASEEPTEEKEKIMEDELDDDDESTNPWLKPSTKPLLKAMQESSSQFARVGRQTKALEKLVNDRKDRISKQSGTVEDDDVELDLDERSLEVEAIVQSRAADESDSEGDDELPPDMIQKDKSQLSQMEVMQLAFADDNAVQDFELEKQSVIQRDLPTQEDLTLPGWGSWSGNGIKPKKDVIVRKVRTVDNVDAHKRKDRHQRHVIINEKRQKKSAKYLAPKLPHGFQNREQYERTIRAPVGKEWQTSNSYQKLTRRKIETVDGVIIHPLKMHSTIAK